MIHGAIQIQATNFWFNFTAIYGLHTVQDRLELWKQLRAIHSNVKGSWLAVGDFNAVLVPEDTLVGAPVETKDLNKFLMDIGMA